MTVRMRQVVCEVKIAGEVINDWISINVTHSLNEAFASATVTCIKDHGYYDNVVEIRAGTLPGNGLATRFMGFKRNPRFSMFPRAVEIQCVGLLGKAAEYLNGEDPETLGGLTITELIPDPMDHKPGFARASEIIAEVLRRAGIHVDPMKIHSTNRLYGFPQITGQSIVNPTWTWGSGLPTVAELSRSAVTYQGYSNAGPGLRRNAGESALSYIQKYDTVDAVYIDGPPMEGGFYRTFEALDGSVWRLLVGGRPRGALSKDDASNAEIVFEENFNILEGTVERQYPLGNRSLVVGATVVEYPSVFEAQVANPLMPLDQFRYDPNAPSSDMITRSLYAQYNQKGYPSPTPQYGMDAETVAKARVLDVSRETVQSDLTTAEDWTLYPTQTHRVQPANISDPRIAMGGAYSGGEGGENVWCTSATFSITKGQDGAPVISQTVLGIGGGMTGVGTTPSPIGPNNIAESPGNTTGGATGFRPIQSDTEWPVILTLWDPDAETPDNVPPPDDWFGMEFDTDGWSSPYVADTGGQSPLPGTDPIWNNVIPQSNSEQILLRHTWTMPEGTVSDARLVLLSNAMLTIWINGEEFMTDIVPVPPGSSNAIDIPFIMGGDNVFAVQATARDEGLEQPLAYLSYYIVCTLNPASPLPGSGEVREIRPIQSDIMWPLCLTLWDPTEDPDADPPVVPDNVPPPDDWFVTDYDSADWFSPYVAYAAGDTPFDGTHPIWNNVVPQSDNEQVLFRHSWTMPEGTASGGNLYLMSNAMLTVWINGAEFMTDVVPVSPGSVNEITDISFIMGGDNVLAIQATARDASTAYLDYYLTVTVTSPEAPPEEPPP